MLKVFSLKGKTALITGGGTGIGFGIAKAMMEAGAKVIIIGRREEALQQAQLDLGGDVHYFVFDLANTEGISALIDLIEIKVGPIDILVNNAGAHLKKYALDTTDAEFEKIIQTNVLSVFSLSRSCASKMVKRKNGVILFIGSMTGMFGMDRVVAYGTSKTALTGLMQNLVTEFSKYNVRVNTIVPGWIESPMFFKAIGDDPQRKEKIVNRIAMEGFGKPEDVGNAAVFLSSSAARYITGVLLPVDGGATVNF
ncbi:SDR family NAD(P)-dependent oxidoreductase [Sphingobacterium kitahiroshimense]|uniref:SDR family oxidoreductase n=1 Tax=Sphingobacterium kitahiroshimense TaxID=470446 RepID=A0ABV0BWU7_9SPHI